MEIFVQVIKARGVKIRVDRGYFKAGVADVGRHEEWNVFFERGYPLFDARQGREDFVLQQGVQVI